MRLQKLLVRESEITGQEPDSVRRSWQSCPAVTPHILVSWRGEKNATIESVEKIATALNLPMSKLFEQLGGQDDGSRNIPLECYEFLSAKTPEEQEQLFKILLEMDKYRSK